MEIGSSVVRPTVATYFEGFFQILVVDCPGKRGRGNLFFYFILFYFLRKKFEVFQKSLLIFLSQLSSKKCSFGLLKFYVSHFSGIFFRKL